MKVYSVNCLLGIVVDGNSFNLLSNSYIAKNINMSISLTVRDMAISSKFSTHRVFKVCTLGNFQKKFSSPPFWIFEFLPKMEKHKFASISLTVWDRAISLKCFIHRISNMCNISNFQKFYSPQKWRPFWIFEFLPKNGKIFYLLNCAR